MNLNDRLDRLASRKSSGSPSFADQFPDAGASDVASDLSDLRQGKTASLSLRDIDAEDEASEAQRPVAA